MASMDSNPLWHWPEDPKAQMNMPTNESVDSQKEEEQSHMDSKGSPTHSKPARPSREYSPRICRICLEMVLPTYHPPSDNLPNIFQSSPSVTYESTDPEAGRLIRPCTCKGSSRYVHEGCLQAWRHADPAYGKRNYWQCPTCGFKYRLERMQWGRWISSTSTQIALTISILLLTMFLLGFIADPIINLYLDPYTIISSAPSKLTSKFHPIVLNDEPTTWTEHFLKGLASLGLLSFIKVLFALSPWQWWNIRSSGMMSGNGRAGGNGRDRLASLSWIVIVVGVGTFLWAVYKAVRTWSRRALEKAGERVMDVQGDDEEDAVLAGSSENDGCGVQKE